MLRLLFLIPVVLFIGVSAVFNVLFSLTLSDGAERWAWVALGVGAAAYSGMGLDIARVNWQRGSPAKAVIAYAFLAVALAWDARCTYGFASIEQDRARSHIAEQERKRANAETRVKDARRSFDAYADAGDPIAADAAVDALAKRTNEDRCKARTLPEDLRRICDDLTAAQLAATRAHAKTRLAGALAEAEQTLELTKAPPSRDSLADLIGPELAKWLPAVVLQLGTLLGVFAAAIPPKPKTPPCPVPGMPANAPNLTRGGQTASRMTQGTTRQPKRPPAPKFPNVAPVPSSALAATVARLIADPDQCPPGLGLDANGWLAGPQRPLATLLGVPVSRLNRELKAAVLAGALEVDTSGHSTRIRLARN